MATSGTSHYYYYENQKMNLGLIKTDMLIIGFVDGTDTATKEKILAEYDFLSRILDETTSGSADLTVVMVKPDANLTPGTMEVKMNLLEQNPQIMYASPFFPPNVNSPGRLGISNQFLVTLESESDMKYLENLLKRTRTRLVEPLGPLTYIVAADKNSAGNALDMANYFHESQGIKNAEPDFFHNLILDQF
ncbi:MAG TPA: hypothetical protein VK927_08795 [Adhaeribacter sp.]|nr:hypothetical protein [Adhaeribacter sp.]